MIPWKIWIFVISVILSIGTSPMQGNPLPYGYLTVTAKGLEPDCAYIVIHPFADRNGVTFTHILVEPPTRENGHMATVRLTFSGTEAYITHLEMYQYRTGGELIYGKDKYIPGWWWTGATLPDEVPNNGEYPASLK